ncbi:MAG: YceI family protein, partial [Streptosporangiaceae bacterium]
GQDQHRPRRSRHTRDTADPRPGRYENDTSCSAVTFRTRHLFGLAPVRGRFAVRAGTVDVAEPLAGSSVYVRIDPASFRTGNGQRDDRVRSERLLDVVRYPVITFRSEGVDGQALTGTLTVRNVTMPVTLSIEGTAVQAGWFDARASTRIDRTEFGVTAYRGLAGRYLDLTIEVRCVRT